MSFQVMYWLFAAALLVCFIASGNLLQGLRRQQKNLFWWHVVTDLSALAALWLLLSILETIAAKLHLW